MVRTPTISNLDPDMKTWSDGALLRATDDDPEAFGVFYDRHVRAIMGLIYASTGSPDSAADITAETFARAYLARGRYRDQAPTARSWLAAIAQNELRKTLRKGRTDARASRRLGVERPRVDDISIERMEEILDLAPMRASVRAAMGNLSPRVADAIRLRVEMGLPYQDVARRLGCSEQAARTRVCRGLSELEKALEVST